MNIKLERSTAATSTEPSPRVKGAKWDLRLYVAGKAPKGVTAFKNLKLICEEQLKGNYNIKVIDLLKKPNSARENQIFAIPTLVRQLPLPVKNIIGDLSNTERVLFGLNLK